LFRGAAFCFPVFQNITCLYSDDTWAIRYSFGGWGAIHDGGISIYSTGDSPNGNDAAYTPNEFFPNSVELNNGIWGYFSLTNPVTIENSGTDAIVNPAIEIYLTPKRMSWDNPTYLETSTMFGELAPHHTLQWEGGFTSVLVPPTVAPGYYYIGLFLRDNKDEILRNNSSWTNYGQRIYVQKTRSITPGYSMQLEPGTLGPEGQLNFTFSARSKAKYFFSLCPADGGSANFDSIIEIVNSAKTVVASNDDTCGLSSKIGNFTPGIDGSYTIRVKGYNGQSGLFVLAYSEKYYNYLPVIRR
jgi:hypothetical protein